MHTSGESHFTHDEFLEIERQSPFRHEYIRGYIEMLAGGSERHALLCATMDAKIWLRHLGMEVGLADLYRRIGWTAA